MKPLLKSNMYLLVVEVEAVVNIARQFCIVVVEGVVVVVVVVVLVVVVVGRVVEALCNILHIVTGVVEAVVSIPFC